MTKSGGSESICKRFGARGKPNRAVGQDLKKFKKLEKKCLTERARCGILIKSAAEADNKSRQNLRMRELKKVRKNLKKALDKGKRVC